MIHITEFLVKKHLLLSDYDFEGNIEKNTTADGVELLIKGWKIGIQSTKTGENELVDWARMYKWMMENDNKGFTIDEIPFKKFGIKSKDFLQYTLEACETFKIYKLQGNKYYAMPVDKWTNQKNA